MNTVIDSADFDWRPWWPLAAGLATALVVSYVRLFSGAWTEPGGDHAPVVVAMALFLFWHQRKALAQARPPASVWPGAVLIGAGLALFLLGVRTRISSFEALSHVPLIAGAIWLVGGQGLLRRLWFSLLFLLLSVPLPTFLLGMVTGNLKDLVSYSAVELLFHLGYPIARDGVVITIGSYQLLVAEACSGLNSIVSLAAVGLFYLYLAPPDRLWKLAIAMSSILPIAIAANTVRIMFLTLITYHFGDGAGQGFLHEFAGMTMFGFALFSFFALSSLLSKTGRTAEPMREAHA